MSNKIEIYLLKIVNRVLIDKPWSKFWHKYRPVSCSPADLITKLYLSIISYFFRSPAISSLTDKTTLSFDL